MRKQTRLYLVRLEERANALNREIVAAENSSNTYDKLSKQYERLADRLETRMLALHDKIEDIEIRESLKKPVKKSKVRDIIG